MDSQGQKPIASAPTLVMSSVDEMRDMIRLKSKLKGRQVDDVSVEEVQTLLKGTDFQRRDLLIENLHKINDTYAGLRERHLAALAKLMNISMAEVFEVATFYHHFE